MFHVKWRYFISLKKKKESSFLDKQNYSTSNIWHNYVHDMTSHFIIMTSYVITTTSWHTGNLLHILDNNSWYYTNLIIDTPYFPFLSWIFLPLWKTKNLWFINIRRCHWQNPHNSASTFAITTKITTKLLNRYKLKVKKYSVHSSKCFCKKVNIVDGSAILQKNKVNVYKSAASTNSTQNINKSI